jgi:hypothetical protein
MDAQQIARLIDEVASLAVRGEIELTDASALNKALWNTARANGCRDEVSALVQAAAMDEINSLPMSVA